MLRIDGICATMTYVWATFKSIRKNILRIDRNIAHRGLSIGRCRMVMMMANAPAMMVVVGTDNRRSAIDPITVVPQLSGVSCVDGARLARGL